MNAPAAEVGAASHDPRHHPAMLVGAGLFIGVMAGFTGMGGGFLMVPLLLALQFPSRRAVATAFVAILITTVSALVGHTINGNIHVLVGGLLGLGGIAGAQIGARLVKRVSTRTFRRIFAVILFGISIALALNGWNALQSQQAVAEPGAVASTATVLGAAGVQVRLDQLPWLAWALVPMGFAVGIAGSFSGMGGGFLLVPILLGLGMPHTGAVGCSMLAVLLISLSALQAHRRDRAMHWRTGLLLGVGGFGGGVTGSVLVRYVGGPHFKLIFAVVLLGIALHTARATRKPNEAASS